VVFGNFMKTKKIGVGFAKVALNADLDSEAI
jgi:hypothetical protein